ncbi:MAG: hypothetical protein ACW972_02645 [Promethearchaeota archaeon]|jgi:predicted  nucleic acid-binding Zn-ribbon protein
MRGIVILTLSKNAEPAIDVEYPEGITEELQISTSGLLSLYEQHKTVKTGPNYLEMQIKRNVSVASFFTGHSERSFLGKPDHAITIFLSDDDTLPRTFEGQVRRIAFELLPKREDPDFYNQFVGCFNLLKKGELDPYYQQMVELTQDLSSKKERIDDLAQKVSLLVSDRSDHLRNVDALKDEINGLYVKMDNWSAQMAELNEYNASLTMKIKDLNQSSSQQKDGVKQKDDQIAKLQEILKEKEEIEEGAEMLLEQVKLIKVENENLNQEINKLNETNKKLKFQVLKKQRESETHLETITNLKLAKRNIQQQIDSIDTGKKKNRDEIFELKKEIKVLRRERDHYQDIIKKNKLL